MNEVGRHGADLECGGEEQLVRDPEADRVEDQLLDVHVLDAFVGRYGPLLVLH